MKVTVITLIIGALGSVTKLRKVLKTWGNLLSLKLQRETNADAKKKKLSKIIIIIIITIIIIKAYRPHRFHVFFHHSSLLAIAPSWSSRRHQVPTLSWWMLALACRPTFVSPCVGVHRRTLLRSSSLLQQQCSVCLTCLTSMVCEMGRKEPFVL